MKKNTILLLLILSFSMRGLMVSAHDIEVPNADGVMIYYNYINDGKELEVSFLGNWYGFVDNEYSGGVVIPEKVIIEERTLEVTSIGSGAFSYCHELTSITIPNSVTKIGDYAFDDCRSLSSVNLPNSLTSIADWTFADCSGLTSVSIPNSVTKIGDYAFDGCYCLPSVTIPNSVTTIGVGAFGLCVGLTSITIPNSVTTIGDYAFQGCNYLNSVSIGEGVTSIGVYAFAGCLRLPSIIIPDGVTSIADFTFYKCYALASVAIGSGVTSIGEGAFWECTSLTSVTIPESVTTIGEWAFNNCTSLTTITIPNSVTTIGNSAFFNCYDLVDVNISDLEAFCKIQFEGDFFNLHYLYLNGKMIRKNLPIPESLTSIGNYAFSKCLGFTSITIPNSVTSIGYNAFAYCFNTTSISIGNSVKRIGDCAFSYCTGLKDMYCYAEQVPEIGNDIFIYSNQANATLHVPASSVGAYQAAEQWKDFKEIVALPALDDYRTMVKDGKVWKFGFYGSGNPVQHVEYFYFDGDTIIDGKACKQMMCQQYYNLDASDDANISQFSPLSYVGAWYEENKKVYTYDTTNKQFVLMYDFSVDANDTLVINQEYYRIGPRQTGGLKGFKGVYRDIWWLAEEGPIYSPSWLEGVGSIDGPTINVYDGYIDPLRFLMSCTVDDEVIYFNDEYEDGATPEELNANKHRFDFTHTIKTKPKTRKRGEEESPRGGASAEMQSLYGEYNQQQLSIHLDPLIETYVVSITNESNEVVYEKTVNTVDIVGLNIDISTFANGRYKATVENGDESFAGEFEMQTTGIEAIRNKKEDVRTYIYNLQGQRIRFLQKGLNIVNGRKVYVK